MIRQCDNGHPPLRVESGTRCPSCRSRRDARPRVDSRERGTPAERGYGTPHRAERRRLAASLPMPCGYCGVEIGHGDRFDAAHVVDGDPYAGYVAAHPRCNQRAKAANQRPPAVTGSFDSPCERGMWKVPTHRAVPAPPRRLAGAPGPNISGSRA